MSSKLLLEISLCEVRSINRLIPCYDEHDLSWLLLLWENLPPGTFCLLIKDICAVGDGPVNAPL